MTPSHAVLDSRVPGDILIVDDTPDNLRLLSNMLTKQGFKVRLAPNGKLALMNVDSDPPDLILLDIKMPGLSGYDVCTELKENPRTEDIPVIFLSALDQMEDKIKAFTLGGVDYVTKPFQVEEVLARVQTHLALRNMRRDLEEQNLELDAFAHTVAHDLKNPLHTLLGYLSVLKTDMEVLPESVSQLVDVGITAGFRMNNIVDELLLLASVRKEDVAMTSIDMGAAVDRAFARLADMVNKYGPEIIMPEDWPSAVGYAPWIEEIWVNYLSNGLKYGGKPPQLSLGADIVEQGMIRFWIEDNGPGLDAEAQSRLFTEFTRLDRVRAQGHGLGLSIVRRIIDKLGGQAGVESAHNEGCLFYFTLPLTDKFPS